MALNIIRCVETRSDRKRERVTSRCNGNGTECGVTLSGDETGSTVSGRRTEAEVDDRYRK